MNGKESIHDYDARKGVVFKKLERSGIPEENKRLIREYLDFCAIENLSKGRIVKYAYYMIRLSEWLGTLWEMAERKDIEGLVLKINESDYAEQSKKEYKACVKKFYKWMLKTDDYPEIVRWIKPHSKKLSKIRLPEEILEKGEIFSMIRHAVSTRDKAFVACLWESGCRIGEFLFIRIKHVTPSNGHGLQIMVNGKTGPRRILLIEMAPILREWINAHPKNDDPEAYVWTTKDGGFMRYGTARALIERVAKNAGVTKKINPHSFRHSRATYVANYMTESQMKMFFGWAQASDMAQIYVHLSGRDVDNAVLKMNGMTTGENGKKDQSGPLTCFKCGGTNDPLAKFCSKCGAMLDEKLAVEMVKKDMERKEADQLMNILMEDDEFKKVLLDRISKLNERKVIV